ncbi:unannotated protein [freshwater metagenome]|uniref:Unannotated protein n=1 Tax=freshwater metagenome TaxID=449393 RepID=A0A6J6L232_9ZZZZ
MEDTIELARIPLLVLRAIDSPKMAPNSSPRSIRHPVTGSLTAAAHLSASGSFAITKSALNARAVSSAKSIAPGSSGLGNATVGKSGSGCACASTKIGEAKPAL